LLRVVLEQIGETRRGCKGGSGGLEEDKRKLIRMEKRGKEVAAKCWRTKGGKKRLKD
jgi:hypothetical protein